MGRMISLPVKTAAGSSLLASGEPSRRANKGECSRVLQPFKPPGSAHNDRTLVIRGENQPVSVYSRGRARHSGAHTLSCSIVCLCVGDCWGCFGSGWYHYTWAGKVRQACSK